MKLLNIAIYNQNMSLGNILDICLSFSNINNYFEN